MSQYILFTCDNTYKWKYKENLKIINTENTSYLQNDNDEKINLCKIYPAEIKNAYNYEFSITQTKVSIIVKYNPHVLSRNAPENLIFIYMCLKSIADELINFAWEKNNYSVHVNSSAASDDFIENSWFHFDKNITEYFVLQKFIKFYNKQNDQKTIIKNVAESILQQGKNKKNIIPTKPITYSPFQSQKHCIYCNSKNDIIICQQCCYVEFSCIKCWQYNKDIDCVKCKKSVNELNAHICIASEFCILPFTVNTAKMRASIAHNITFVSENEKVQKYIENFNKYNLQKNNKNVYPYEKIII